MAQKLSSKDLTELSELLDGEMLAYRKCLGYAVLAQDDTLKKKMGTWANNHKTRYEGLLSILTSAE